MPAKRFKEVAKPDRIPEAEERVLEFWEKEKIFERSVAEREGARDFVFYEGPPTANGKPGVHHVMARLCKDIVCRYKTMRGYRVVRKGGWDTHGLPVEIEVENELGITSKDQIEEVGIGEFNRKCRESVFKYEKEWKKFTKRIGYWLDMDHPYVTCTNEYIESVWWILKEFWKQGLLYEGYKIVPYCPRCGTSLSSHEVSQGYKDVSDPSILVKFKASDADEYFLVWTTTPWTLISNAALAVGPGHEYVRVSHGGETLILASARLGVLEGDHEIVERFKGSELVGRSYEPLFPFFAGEKDAFRVHPADFVSLEDGTGIVHIAPAFGEDDYGMHRDRGVPLFQPVTPEGTFTADIEPWAGKGIKESDPSIITDLKKRGLLYKSGKVKHSYPFCWRCSKALIYYARRSWYIRTTQFKDELIAANQTVNWMPREVGEFRFGNWLENNIDWALSRERYWGTPLNIWVCADCGGNHAVGSVDELREMCVNFPGDAESLDLHRPAVDLLELECPRCSGRMKRVKEVIDCWFDSGSMPFAQYHYPFGDKKKFEEQFPADYISEGIDQSRGWFYSLLVISVFLKKASPYRNVLTTGMILDKDGQKMSKSRGNAVEPWDVLNREGADALRWYLLTSSPPWAPTRFDRKGVVDAAQKLLGTLRNVYTFFAMYAEIDGYRVSGDVGEPGLLDKWILSRFNSVAARVRELMDAYDVTRACRLIHSFVLDELSNWYVRRSRRRFWKGEMGPDKAAAYDTLYRVFTGVIKLLAPFTPFLSEEIYQALKDAGVEEEPSFLASVHLEPYPEPDRGAIDEELEETMETAVMVSSLGRTIRNEAGIKIRQPLGDIIIHDPSGRAAKMAGHSEIKDILLDELHMENLVVADDLKDYVHLEAVPNYPALGRRFGKRVPDVVKAMQELSQEDLARFKRDGGIDLSLGDRVSGITKEEMEVRVKGKEGYGAREEHGITVVLDLELTEELRIEGIAREIVNRLQNLRKGAGLEVTDRIRIRYEGADIFDKVFSEQGEMIKAETLAVEMTKAPPEGAAEAELVIGGDKIVFSIEKEN
jgi:isoleucyl-tRNA synthetase